MQRLENESNHFDIFFFLGRVKPSKHAHEFIRNSDTRPEAAKTQMIITKKNKKRKHSLGVLFSRNLSSHHEKTTNITSHQVINIDEIKGIDL
jgi:hypothetical protein